MASKPVFYNIIRAKATIMFLILSASCVYFMTWQLKSQRQCQTYLLLLEDGKHTKQPVIYVKGLDAIEPFLDVFLRWGYDKIGARHSERTAHLFTHEDDEFTSFFFYRVLYRIFQKDTEDKLLDHVPKMNENIAFKKQLSSRGGKYIPKSFILPDESRDFFQYIYLPENSDKVWIEKSYFRRENMVKTIDELDLEKKCIIQEFIRNPFTIDGRKFSIGIYVGFASANPLRVYVLDNILMLRFAEKRYYPENLDDHSTYITDGDPHEIGAEIKRASQVEPIKTFMERYSYTAKKAFNNFMISKGEDSSKVYAQIYDAIRDVLGTNVKDIEENSDPETKYTQFTRWDFVLDANMTVHFLEVNSVPYLNCYKLPELWGKHFCDHVVYNTFRAMGLEKPFHWKNNRAFHIRDTDLQISNEICYSIQCHSCDTWTCAICSHCLSSRQTRILKEILREHLHRGETRLLHPEGKNNDNNDGAMDQDRQLTDNDVITHWLNAKCKQDHNWCSPYVADT